MTAANLLTETGRGVVELGSVLDLLVAFVADERDNGTGRAALTSMLGELLAADMSPDNVAGLLSLALGRLVDAGLCADCAKAATVSALLEA
jgi:hypothetical protein